MASKRVIAKIRVVIPAGGAKPAPPVGPALGQGANSHTLSAPCNLRAWVALSSWMNEARAGLNIMNFCKDFNARTANLQDSIPVPTVITAFEDKSFEYAAGLDSGSKRPGHEVAGKVSLKHVYEIARVKHADSNLNYMDLKTVCSHIIGSAKSMGLKVVPKPEDM